MTITAPEPTSTRYTQLAGIAMPYHQAADIGGFTEEFTPGALAKSIHDAARGIPLLLWHDRHSFPIGKLADWDETRDALLTTFTLDRGPIAQDAGRLAAEEFFAYLSIGFAPVNVEWTRRNGRDHARIIEARLLEVSLVSTPAYAGAYVQRVDSEDTSGQRTATTTTSATRWPQSPAPARQARREPLRLSLFV